MPSHASDPVRDALAWFILNDETNSGGENEDSNGYWLAGRRLAKMYFASDLDLTDASSRHSNRMTTRTEWPEELDELPESHSAHDLADCQVRVKEWQKCGC